MDSDRVALFLRLFDRSGPRRSVFGALFGTMTAAGALGANAAKRHAKSRKGTKRGKKPRRHGRDAGAQAKKAGNHCITPDGADLNAIYGVSAQFINPFCTVAGSGEQWVSPGPPWFVNHIFASVPEGFVPKGDTPLEDFFAKFSEIKVVIDPGMKKQQTVVFPNDGNLFSAPGNVFAGSPAEWFVVSPITLGTLSPLPVGQHKADVFWVLSEMHCDGVGDVADENCLPAGEIPWGGRRVFNVVPGHNA